MFIEGNDHALASVERCTSQQGAILVPNSCLAHGNGQHVGRKGVVSTCICGGLK